MAITTFPGAPHWDDYDEAKKYLRVLFRPGVSLQVRELNQLQTYLQTQVERVGSHLFKQGAMVVPGQVAIDTRVIYLKIDPQTTDEAVPVSTFAESLIGTVITGLENGVTATVITYALAEGTDPVTLYVRYNDAADKTVSNVTTNIKEFVPTERISATIGNNERVMQIKTLDTTPIGKGSIASIEAGIYFINGQFVLVDKAAIILDKYSNLPSYRVGLTYTENVVTPATDVTLFDNATGTPNKNAPGAYRYQILTDFIKLPIDDNTSEVAKTFIELVRVEDGIIKSIVDRTNYAELYKTLARRTFDESGNYTTKPFRLSIREHRNNYRDEWKAKTDYLRGDVVTSGGYYFTALSDGTSGDTKAPHEITGTNGFNVSNKYTLGGIIDNTVKWAYTDNPAFNLGYKLNGDEKKFAVAIEPGKGYIQGYEVEKIATEYLTLDKARTYKSVSRDDVSIDYGNYIKVTNVRGVPPIVKFETVALYDQLQPSSSPQDNATARGTQVGTARIRAMEFSSGSNRSTANGVYDLYLYDVQMYSGKTFERNVKQIYFNSGATVTNFVADVTETVDVLAGTISADANSTTITGTGTSFDADFNVGDYIVTQLNTGTVVKRRITAKNVGGDKTKLTINAAFDASTAVTGQTYSRLMAYPSEPFGMSMFFPLDKSYVRSVRNSSNNLDITYTTTQKFVITGNTSTNLTVTTQQGQDKTVEGVFSSSSINDNGRGIVVINTSTGQIITPTGYSGSGSSITITGVQSDSTATNYVVFAPIFKSNVGEKTKTLVYNYAKDFTKSQAGESVIKLGKADGYRLVAVKMFSTDTATTDLTNTTDITSWYSFDNGQRDTFYDLCTITRKSGYNPPTGAIKVIFDYFEHSDTGDYFTINSYQDLIHKNSDGSTYSAQNEIPFYVGTDGIVPLSDVIDFRPRISDSGSDYSASGTRRSEMPKIGFDCTASYSYYIGRSDKIALNLAGDFFAVSGVPSENIQEPDDPELAMLLAKLNVSAYTLFPDQGSINIETVDNKRYTMRDIGKLDKRIENLEYYTSLSLLEQETKSLSIQDEFGLDRFKRGFIVDSFKGQDVGDVASVDYRCAIDMEAQELRPFYSMSNVNLVEENQQDSDRSSDGYKLSGDIVTLDYDTTSFIKQLQASTTENVNPFAVFTFFGAMTLNPPSDEWFEVNRRPDIVNNVEGNFAAVSAMARVRGILGTVWGAWQTNWTGSSRTIDRLVVTSGFDKKNYGLGVGKWNDRHNFTKAELAAIGGNAVKFGQDGVGKRVLTYQTTATTVGQSRTGVQTSVVPKVDYQVVNDKVLQSSFIPYIRSRELLFVCQGMRAKTELYSFFDDTPIKDYVTPATVIKVTRTAAVGDPELDSVKNFITDINAASDADHPARRANNSVQVAFNKGDILYVQKRGSTTYTVNNSPITAIVVMTEKSADGEFLHVVNVKGSTSFTAGDIVVGSISGVKVKVATTTITALSGNRLATNANGSVAGVFSIPCSDNLRFRTGVREFRLTDSSTGGLNFTTQGKGSYRAQGVLETRQRTVNAVRNAEIVQRPVSESRVTEVYSPENLIRDTGWYDPLAQTFMVETTGGQGAFLTHVDIYFATKDSSVPVTLEIREVVNGYPGQKILPFSKVVLTPDKINVSSDNYTPDAESAHYDALNPNVPNESLIKTTFKFPSPVYVMDSTEYCIVLLSDSNNYRVWISQMGQQIAGPGGGGKYIDKQPYAGVLFKSQNASTWTANQDQDLKFEIHRAKFKTTSSTVSFINDTLPATQLDLDPFTTVAGKYIVRVNHPDHGMPSGAKVIFDGLDTSTTYNGIPGSAFYPTIGYFTIANVTLDSYTISVGDTNAATLSGHTGGSEVVASTCLSMDAASLITTTHTFPSASIGWSIKTTNTNAINDALTTAEEISPNQTYRFNSNKIVTSDVNKSISVNVLAELTGDEKNDAISPVIDTARLSLTTVKNKIDNFTYLGRNVADIDSELLVQATSAANTRVSFDSASKSISVDSNLAQDAKKLNVGQWINVTNATNTANNGDALVTGITTSGSSLLITTNKSFITTSNDQTATIKYYTNFTDEIAPEGGTAISKYITRVINLQESSTFLKIMFAANAPLGTSVEVWYKLLPASSNGDVHNYNFVQATTPLKELSPSSSYSTFTDIEYDLKDLPAFDSVVVKLVFKSNDTAKVPRVKDLRVIACA